MILSTGESIPGAEITEVLGVVKASTVRTRHIGRDIQASLRNLVGGEVGPYVQMLDNARDEATDRMIAKAEELGADAIITVRFTTSSVMQGASEILVYGTAVKTGQLDSAELYILPVLPEYRRDCSQDDDLRTIY